MTGLPKEKLTGALRRSSVKKHVAAIHVSGKLTLLQRKLSNVLLLNAYDTLRSQPSHRIDARTLCVMAGYGSNDIETLKASLTGLAETVATWNLLDEAGQAEWGVSSLLSYARLKGGVCEYAYSPALAEKLDDPEVFALINMSIMREFTSGHALALYENCYRFVRTGSTGWWGLDLFRRIMGVDGSSYYDSFKQLNAKVIKPAVAEVNKLSNIVLEPEFRKQGRRVTDLRFKISSNPQEQILAIDDGGALRRHPLYGRLRELGVSDRLARQWMSDHEEAYIAEKLDLVAGQAGVKSPVRYLAAALSRDFVPEPRTAAPTPARTARSERLSRVQAAIAARSPTQRDADTRAFLNGLPSDDLRADFERHGWMSPLCATEVFAFWERRDPAIFEGIEG